MNRHEASMKAFKDNTPTRCMMCGKDCDRTEIVDTDEAWERWCYCPDCDIETFHLIEEHFIENEGEKHDRREGK